MATLATKCLPPAIRCLRFQQTILKMQFGQKMLSSWADPLALLALSPDSRQLLPASITTHLAIRNMQYAFANCISNWLPVSFQSAQVALRCWTWTWPVAHQIKRPRAININKNHTKIVICKVQSANENGNCS